MAMLNEQKEIFAKINQVKWEHQQLYLWLNMNTFMVLYSGIGFISSISEHNKWP